MKRKLLVMCVALLFASEALSQTITAHSGAFDTPDNSMEFIETALRNKSQIIEIDVNMRPDGTLVINHDEVKTNADGTDLAIVLKAIKKSKAKINLDIKNTDTLPALFNLVRKLKMTRYSFLTGIRLNNVPLVKKYCPGLVYYLNYDIKAEEVADQTFQQTLLADLRSSGAVGINVHYKEWSRELTDLLHANGFEVSLWTLNDAADAPFVIGCNPDNITSRHPDMVRRMMQQK